jgi:hypothetical protein
MPLMSGSPVLNRRCGRILLGAAVVAGMISACETVTTAPPDTHIVGSWRLDKSASDDPDVTIAKAMHSAESKLHRRLAKYGYGPDHPDTSSDQLVLAADADLVTITEDQLPPRDYHVGERLSRIDEYGTARISATWSHDAFVMKSSYSSPHATRIDTYEVNPSTGALTLTQRFDDPIVGKILLHSVYRRS